MFMFFLGGVKLQRLGAESLGCDHCDPFVGYKSCGPQNWTPYIYMYIYI